MTIESESRIPFGRPTVVGREFDYIADVLRNGSMAGGGPYTQRCEEWLKAELGTHRALLTHSCTAALEMAAILAEIGPGDEVVMPSFTFSATATAFVLRGATPVFVDIRPDTLNIDERLIEGALTPRTRAIAVVHYAGRACAMDAVMAVANARGLVVVEDAAHAHLARDGARPLGTIGHLGCLSFHETKNVIAGEGGALLVNDPRLAARAEIVRDKGTDRSRFLRGEVDKYTWQDVGSSYGPSEIVSAFLLAQLERAAAICDERRALCDAYRAGLAPLAARGLVTLPEAAGTQTNGHIFWLLTRDEDTRNRLLAHLGARGIQATFHYVPLHSAPAGRRHGRAGSSLAVTDSVSARLVRLPLFLNMTGGEIARVVAAVEAFYA
ncbi:dTDP-4-amino-4,6-dideoxygalactose transaminase [Methylobacterium sp. WSM2598]|uniref:dTDP-4-amino-4,6-dideoxygalactose transaminase n=1 Tax=Methylobacterium sp. WSM2598 TaxID=398261 RepID=UPI000363EE6B|nr:dTDP-4-amino-4,6-dideoxygalactose transaminase [Methylobacterium sp. WSM2598]